MTIRDWTTYRPKLIAGIGALAKLSPDTVKGSAQRGQAGAKNGHLEGKARALAYAARAMDTLGTGMNGRGMITTQMLAVLCAALPVPAWAGACAPASAPAPVAAVQSLYGAMMAGDKAGVARNLSPQFYAFDGGKQLSSDQFVGLIDWLKAAHLKMTWTVNAPRPNVMCDVALVTWDNRGTSTDAGGTKHLEWLESAVERWQDGAWKLVFFQSAAVD